jgi:hypothetical protein
MEVRIDTAQFHAQRIQWGDILTFQELSMTGTGIRLMVAQNGMLHIAEAHATLVLTEAEANRFLTTHPLEPVRDLQVAMLSGLIRFTGRYGLPLGIAVPFRLTARPEIENGCRIRLEPCEFRLIGAHVPGIGVQAIGQKINMLLATHFDTSRLPLNVRLTGITVEPGRLLLSGMATIEIHPSSAELMRAGSAKRATS